MFQQVFNDSAARFAAAAGHHNFLYHFSPTFLRALCLKE
jgi:hypothetical protein